LASRVTSRTNDRQRCPPIPAGFFHRRQARYNICIAKQAFSEANEYYSVKKFALQDVGVIEKLIPHKEYVEDDVMTVDHEHPDLAPHST
jgi:hypothetical protein